MQLLKKKDVDMLNGSIMKGLFAIALPLMIMNVLQSLFNIIDMTVLKSFGPADGYAVGAVGACGTLISLITGLLIGCSAGANVVVAKRVGSGDIASARRAAGTAVAFAIVGGLVISAVGILGARVFLTWMNCPDRLIDEAVLYFRLYFAGIPISMLYNFAAAVLRSTGDSRSPMLYLTLGGAVKILLNYVFVAHCNLTVVGVAIATMVSWSIAATLCLRTLVRSEGAVRLEKKHIRFYRTELREILYIGLPTGLQQALYSIANVIISATVNTFGTEATTGISIANNFDGLLYQICHSPSLAVMPYVSQNVGAGNIKRAKQAVWRGILFTTLLGATFGAASAFFAVPLSSIMSSNAAVIAFSRQKMIIISSTYFICGINDIMGATMRGMGKPIIPTVTTLLYMCAFRFLWVFVIFPLSPSLTFLYFVWPVGWVLSLLTLLCFYFPRARRLAMESAARP